IHGRLKADKPAIQRRVQCIDESFQRFRILPFVSLNHRIPSDFYVVAFKMLTFRLGLHSQHHPRHLLPASREHLTLPADPPDEQWHLFLDTGMAAWSVNSEREFRHL